MQKTLFLLLFGAQIAMSQIPQKIEFNKGYDNINVDKSSNLNLLLPLEKDASYQIYVMQQGIDVMLTLFDKNGKQLLEKDSPNGKKGFEIIEFTPTEQGNFVLTIKKFEEEGNADSGKISFYIKKLSKQEVTLKAKTAKELVVENKKNTLTLDIDHFWEAFDQLKNCKTQWDSVLCFQNYYLDRATDGLKDFIERRNFTAEEYVEVVRKYPKYYASVRPYTYETKAAEPLIQEVFDKMKNLYANFKPFKVCFAIGPHRTGGTVSNQFVLIGTEMTTVGKNVDYSEFSDDWKPADPNKEINIPLRIKGIVAHESVHTQQSDTLSSNAIVCQQLNFCLREGSANFIGELVTGTTNYSAVNDYGDKHEKDLWNEFKASLCHPTGENWLYNGNRVKDKPADLGYYIGYKITQAYYNNAKDKHQAIIDILEMDNPILFLEKSGYDKQKKN
jgi:hypothetical protein